MQLKTFALASAMAVSAALTLASVPASAYTACNREGDCWHTDSRVHFKGAAITFHNDKWWDRMKSNARYHWHDADNDHDWHKGYWSKGEWHAK
jgi:hypothetical protein